MSEINRDDITKTYSVIEHMRDESDTLTTEQRDVLDLAHRLILVCESEMEISDGK